MDRGPQITSEVQEGQVLAGKYRIERSIGEGGMGMVVAAHHLELDEPVAIKLLRPEALGNPDAVMRFAREARASVKIKSEHVARTLDVGKLENGAPYIVMEYLHGLDLSARLKKSGPLAIDEAVDFTLQACQALADAHAIGIVHRDIKPSNLFVIRKTDGNESVKVLDFGISKVTGLAAAGTDMGMTRTQTIMGSPLYMSPEQMASSRDAGPSADIWALGVTLHELLTGKAPFEAESITELCSKVLTQTSPRLHEGRSDTPEGLQAIIDKCLEKDPTRRYLNMAELAIALMPFGTKRGRIAAEGAVRVLQTAGVSTGPLVLPPSVTSMLPSPLAAQVTTGTVAPWSNTQPETKRRTGLLIGAAAVALFIGAAVVAAVVMMRKPTPQPPVAAASPAVSMPANSPVVAQPAVTVAQPAAPAANEPAPIALASASASAVAATPDTSKKPVPGRIDNKQKTANKHDSASPAASATPKGSQKAKPAAGVTDFGGRLY
jgi:serine/threonine-protein kinase